MAIRLVVLTGLLVFLGLSLRAAAEPLPVTRPIECKGPFAKDMSHKKLVAMFGAKNVELDLNYTTTEGIDSVSILYPNAPSLRVHFVWANRRLQGLERVEFHNESKRAIAPGIHIGSSLEEVEVVNGGPFRLAGFGWDYAGIAGDWQGGLLGQLGGGCKLVLFFDASSADGDRFQATLGDGERDSTDPSMRAVKPIVRSFMLEFGR